MRLIIVDPSLKDDRGHHRTLTQRIVSGAASLGIPSLVVAHAEFKSEEFPCLPIFSSTMYDVFDSDPSAIPDQLAEELTEALTRCHATSNDLVLIHTLYGALLLGIASVMHALPCARLVSWHLCTPYLPNVLAGPFETDVIENKIRALDASSELRVFFYAETDLLARGFLKKHQLHTASLPIPAPERLARGDGKLTRRRQDRRIRLAYVGPAREEKGFTQLPGLIKAASKHKRKIEEAQFEFFVQTTPQVRGYPEEIVGAVSELENLQREIGDNLTLHKNTLTTWQYESILDWCDVVIMLYDRDRYEYRGSGIAVDAVTHGRILMATEGTFPAMLWESGGSGFVVNLADDADKHLAYIQSHLHQLSHDAERLRESYLRGNSSTKYCMRVISNHVSTTRSHVSPTDYATLPRLIF